MTVLVRVVSIRVWFSIRVLRVALYLFIRYISIWCSVRVWFPVWVRFSIWVWVGTVAVLVVSPLRVRSVLSMWVWLSISGCSLPLILRVFVVLIVVFHLNYPLVHYICDDK